MGGWFSFEANYQGTDSKTQDNSSGYGTRTPNVSGEYTDAFNNFRGSMSPTGFNGAQQEAFNFNQNYLKSGGAAGRTAPQNAVLNDIRNNLARFTTGTPNLLGASPTSTAAQSTAAQATAGRASTVQSQAAQAQAAQAQAAQAQAALGQAYDSASVDPITAQMIAARQGSEFMKSYQDPYLKDVVDASLEDYDLGAAEGRNALRARSAGAFGNKRTGVAEGQFASDAAIGRGQLSSTLRSNAFNTAAGFGMQDANRFLAADQSNQSADLAAKTTNADNLLRNNQFNAGNRTNVSLTNAGLQTGVNQSNAALQTDVNQSNAGLQTGVNQTNADLTTQNNQFNAGQTNETNRFNTGEENETGRFNADLTTQNNQFNAGQTTQNNQFNAGIQNTRDIADLGSMNAADDRAITALAQQAGITDTIANNIMTADGIDLGAAQDMFTAGTISQAQLQTIIDAAAAYNGSSYTDNRSGNSRTNTDTYGASTTFLA